MPKDMLFPSKRESNNWSEDFQILHKLLIFGSKFKNFGPVWSLSSLEVISPSKCHSKLNNSLVLTKLGWNVCKNHSKLKRFFNHVSLTYLRITYLTCRKSCKNAKNYLKPIFKERENFSQDFISSQIQHYLRFCLKDLNLHQFNKILKNFSMLSPKSNSVNLIKKDQMKKQS